MFENMPIVQGFDERIDSCGQFLGAAIDNKDIGNSGSNGQHIRVQIGCTSGAFFGVFEDVAIVALT